MENQETNVPCCESSTDAPCSCSSNGGNQRKPNGQKKLKVIVCLAVLLAAVSLVAFRVMNTDNNSSNSTTVCTNIVIS
jgi:hypothetical protein